MEISAITLARFLAFVEIADLNPRGQIHLADATMALVKRYGFATFPQPNDEFSETKPAIYTGGKYAGVNNIRFQIHSNGLVVDTTSSTEDSEKVLREMVAWANKELGLKYQEGMIKRWGYFSQLTFYSDIGLASLNPALISLAERVTRTVSKFGGQAVEYITAGVTIGYDAWNLKIGPAPFTIERRVDTPFSDRKYFSSAPLQTDEHITLLKQFEAEIRTSGQG